MLVTNDEPANEAAQEMIRTTIIKLKKLLEDSVGMRVECAKLEFDMLTLYHAMSPEELDGFRDQQENIDISENPNEPASQNSQE